MSNNQPPQNPFVQFITVLLLIGGSGAGYALARSFTDDPLPIILLIVLGGAIGFLMSLITGVANPIIAKIQEGTIKDILLWMGRRGRNKFRDRYLEYLYYNHRTFDVKGLSTQGIYGLELNQVFVDLSIASDERSSLPENPIPTELRAGGHSIWDYLKSKKLRHLAIIGAPGSGKTTLLKHVTLSLALPRERQSKDIPDWLPILLYLRDQAKAIAENPKLKLGDAVRASLDLMDDKPPEGWFEEQFQKGKCLILLDGLDEVADSVHRAAVVKWVEAQIGVYGSCHFVVSSRPHGYRNNRLRGFTLLVVRPFTRRQVEKFVNNWYLANEIASYQNRDPGVEMEALRGARDLLRRIYDKPDIAELAVNPLLLTMIATVHRFRSSLPGRRVELYAEMCDVLLGKKEQASSIEIELTPAQKITVLQPLAALMMVQKTRDINADVAVQIITKSLRLVTADMQPSAFLEMIRNRSGILIEREQGIYAFSHKTFQEYLTASLLKSQGRSDVLVALVYDDWWHETIRLYCAIADATPIIAACLQNVPPPIGQLLLATECDDEALGVEPAVRERLRGIIEQDLDSKDKERRKIAAEARLALRLKRLMPLSKHVYADSSEIPITKAEYQLFIDAAPDDRYMPDYWQEAQFKIGTGKERMLGVTPQQSVGFCDWLTDRSLDSEWLYRLPRNDNELANKGSYWVNQTIVGVGDRFQLINALEVVYTWWKWQGLSSFATQKNSLNDMRVGLRGYNPTSSLDYYANALANVRSLTLASALDRIRLRALSLANPLAKDLVLANDRDGSNSRTSSLDIARDLAIATSRALDRAPTRDLNSSPALASSRARANDLVLSLASDRVLASSRTHDLSVSLVNDRVLASDLANELIGLQKRIYDIPLRELLKLCEEVVSLIIGYIELAGIYDGLEGGYIIFALKRLNGLDDLRRELPGNVEQHINTEPKRNAIGRRDEEVWQKWHDDLEAMMRAYATLVMLEKRRTGEWEPYESIRIVRERRKRQE